MKRTWGSQLALILPEATLFPDHYVTLPCCLLTVPRLVASWLNLSVTMFQQTIDWRVEAALQERSGRGETKLAVTE